MAGESAQEVARRSRERAEALWRRADMFELGAQGEEATAVVLDALAEHGWHTRHDLRWPGRRYANIDHVVVGPSGVFVIDSKNWSGQVAIDHGVLRQDGRARTQAVDGCVAAAQALAAGLPEHIRPHVHAVLCFVGQPRAWGSVGQVVVASPSTISEVVVGRTSVLTEADVVEALAAIDTWAAAAVPTATPVIVERIAVPVPTPAATRRTGRASRTSVATRRSAGRGRGGRVEALVGMILAAAVAVGGFQLTQMTSDPDGTAVTDTDERDDQDRRRDRGADRAPADRSR